MSSAEIDLPAGWQERSAAVQQQPALVEYEHTTSADTTFVVSILEQPFEAGYRVRLSTIADGTDHIRHDYPIGEYDDQRDAAATVERFIEFLDRKLAEDGVSADKPDVIEVQALIDEFTDSRLPASLRRLVDRLRFLP